jgi:hypothetical protein
MEEINFHYSIEPAWKTIMQIEEEIKSRFKPENVSVFEATVMVVSEMIENAIKYGKSQDFTESIDFTFSVKEKLITITVSNPVEDDKHLSEFREHIQQIKNSDDPAKLYTERLRELLERKHEKKAQLGLYRIAYEGKFTLSYQYDNKLLTVNAVRYL